MTTRRESAEILYPFSPQAEPCRAYVAGIRDMLCIVEGSPAASPPSIAKDGRQYFGVLYSLNVDTTTNVYTFYAVNPTDSYLLTFTVPITGGLVRVADSTGSSFMVVDTHKIYRTVAGMRYMPASGAEVEPARLVWRLNEVASITLLNESRQYNPQQRTGLADSVVYGIATDGATLSLVDGYNCHLSYDEDSKTLNIEAAPGEGLGLPTTIPWSTPAPDIATGVLTVNGINNKGDAQIEAAAGVLLEYTDATITLKVRKSQDSA